MATSNDSGRARPAFALTFIYATCLIASAHAAWAGVNVWTGRGPYRPVSVTALAIDPHTPSTLYTGALETVARGGGVFRSNDSGDIWTAVNTGLPPYVGVRMLVIDPGTPSTLYAGSEYGDGVFKSTDSGASWTAITNMNVWELAIDPHTPSTLYAGTDGYGVFKSTDSGGGWSAVNTGLPGPGPIVSALAIDPQTPSTLYTGIGEGVFQSTNGGGSWTAINTGLPSDATVIALAIDPTTPSTLYADADTQIYASGPVTRVVYQSTDSGDTWNAATFPGLPTFDPHTPSTLYAATGEGVYKSTDGGASWSAVNTGLIDIAIPVAALAIDATAPSTLYAGAVATVGQGGGVLQSTNSGANWTAVNTGLPSNASVNALAIDPQLPSTLCAETASAVFQSTDSGGTWNQTTFPGLPVFDPTIPSTLYVRTDDGVFRSTDSGASWDTVLPVTGVTALAISPCRGMFCGAPGTFYAITDAGVFFRAPTAAAVGARSTAT
jgi:photosystem II stability/assembly factor-like uncharacterized protein